MATQIRGKQRVWEGGRDSEGHREYKIVFLVQADFEDGPANVLQTPGLPQPGDFWFFDNDIDLWAFCKQDASVKLHDHKEGEKHEWWTVELRFSTKNDKKSCKETQIDDPLLEPQKVSGSFTKFQEEAVKDRFGRYIKNSAHEQMRGPQVEFDANRPQIRIEQNVADLQLDTFPQMIDTVNDAEIWGVPARCVKLSNVQWERKFFGTCNVYYTRTLEFDINVRTDPETGELSSGFDRDLLDEGTKVLHGHWGSSGSWLIDPIPAEGGGEQLPDPANPQHFDRFKDRNGENARVILDGGGVPADVAIGIATGTGTAPSAPGNIHVEKYNESDFLILGIPTSF